MRSWKTSARESIFSVSLPNHDSNNQRNPPATVESSAPTQRSATPRNAMPCGRCSEKQKRCDISPPYSPTRCGACTKANIPTCPPHKPRRLRKRARILPSPPVDTVQNSARPATYQYQSNDINPVVVQRWTKDYTEDSGATSYPSTNIGLDQSSISTSSSSQMFWPSYSGGSQISVSVATEGPDLGFFAQPGRRSAMQAEELPYDSFYSFSSTFVPSFLSPM